MYEKKLGREADQITKHSFSQTFPHHIYQFRLYFIFLSSLICFEHWREWTQTAIRSDPTVIPDPLLVLSF